MMPLISEIQSQKISHFFDVLDTNRNTVLQPEDFKDVAIKISSNVGFAKDSRDYEHLIVQSYRIFIQILTDLEKHEELEINRKEWLKFFEQNLVATSDNDPVPIKGYITRVVYYIFNLFDENRDGVITIDEYAKMFEVYGIDVTYSLESFQKLDRNSDDVISKEELAEAFYEYFLSRDENAPGNWIFGHWDDN